MVNQLNRKVSLNTDISLAAPALDLVPDSHPSKRSHHIDEIIRSLANSHENKRARQVLEWDRLSRQNLGDVSHRAFS